MVLPFGRSWLRHEGPVTRIPVWFLSFSEHVPRLAGPRTGALAAAGEFLDAWSGLSALAASASYHGARPDVIKGSPGFPLHLADGFRVRGIVFADHMSAIQRNHAALPD